MDKGGVMNWLRFLIYCLTHKPCPLCSGGHQRLETGLCCMCGGEGVVPLFDHDAREGE